MFKEEKTYRVFKLPTIQSFVGMDGDGQTSPSKNRGLEAEPS